MKVTRKCYGCKNDFRKEELVQYAGLNAKTAQWYCVDCLTAKQARERFSNKVCQIFGIKAPGPRIWTERKRLQDTYGYTDDTIIDCLDYIYNVQGTKKLSESLVLVKPQTIDKMTRWKYTKEAEASRMVQAATQKMKEYVVPIKENTSRVVDDWNPDDFIND